MKIIRLIVRPVPAEKWHANARAWPVEARLEDGGDLVATSAMPLYDGARALLKRGCPPGDLLTIRHEGSPHDSFQPTPIGALATMTVEETSHGLVQRPFRAFDRSEVFKSGDAA